LECVDGLFPLEKLNACKKKRGRGNKREKEFVPKVWKKVNI
jgi:hypothetical protein